MVNKLIDYCNASLQNQAIGGLEKAAYKRFLNDTKNPDLAFDEEAVGRFVSFCGKLKHFTGRHAGKVIELQPWQLFVVANILGWRWRSTNRRRFTSSYIEVARKNGKTFLAAALCLYYLIADGEQGAEVDLCANSRDQAAIAFDDCRVLARQLDGSNRILHATRKEILFARRNSKLRCFAADDSKLDGFNASFGLIDEYHSAKNSKIRDVIKSSQAMRTNPHLCTITSAGFSKDSPCYVLRQNCIDILQETKKDDSLFAIIFSLDSGDDWKDHRVWRKANPSIGVTVSRQWLSEQVTAAVNDPTEEVGVLTKNLNCWTDSAKYWIADDVVVKSFCAFSLTSDDVVYVGVDLAATGDLTAVSYLTKRGDKYYFATQYYLPRDSLRRGSNAALYQRWERKGLLNVTDGNVTDYDKITLDITKVAETSRVATIAYDSWNATQWAIDCTAKGLPLQPYSQSIGSFNRPTKELQRLLLKGQMFIEPNDITRYCFANVIIKTDSSGNEKPSKGAYSAKIDGVIAMLMAMGGYLTNSSQTGGGIFVL